MKFVSPPQGRCAARLVLGLLVLSVLPAWAQFKVVGPDGRVTYTDRPPHLDAQPLRLGAPEPAAGAADAADGTPPTGGLPFALRQAVQRYPVRLYTAPACAPCDAARQALQLRGVPRLEWRVETPEDQARLRSEFGVTELPLLLVGRQRHVGFAEADWRLTLDAAGYPATSQLPPGYAMPAARPLQPPAEARPAPEPRSAPGSARGTEAGASPAVVPSAPGGIRF